MPRCLPLLAVFVLVLSGCGGESSTTSADQITSMPSSVISTPWGDTPDGPASLYTLTNAKGNTLKVTDWGGTITSIIVGGVESVVGYDELAPYLNNEVYFGALIGRYGNRIADSRLELGGQVVELVPNEKGNQLHGGPRGFDKYVWQAEPTTNEMGQALILRHVSPDGDQGWPGKLDVQVTYTWTDQDELVIQYEATSDKLTVVNLTNHAYFNLAGYGPVTDHSLIIDADAYTPVNDELIPTGELASVEGTPFDFRTPKSIGQDIKADHPQIKLADGYDHNWVLNNYTGALRDVALLVNTNNNRQLRCRTTEPGVQVFTANFPPGKFTVRNGQPLQQYGGICLETQHFPNSPNQPNFRTPVLKPGETYRTTTIYDFD